MSLVNRMIHHPEYGTGIIESETDFEIQVHLFRREGSVRFRKPQCFLNGIRFLEIAEEEAGLSMAGNKDEAEELSCFTDLDSFTEQYTEALDAEIKAMLKKPDWDEAFNIERLGTRKQNREASAYYYRFECEDSLSLDVNESILVHTRNQDVRGRVVHTEPGSFTANFSTDLGSKMSWVQFRSDSSEITKALLENFEHFMAEPTVLVRSLILNGRRQVTGTVDDLRKSQKQAVEYSLKNPISFIWGPPGTGKTTTLARIAVELRNQGKKVLILSHTNIAVDGAIQKISSMIPDLKPGELIRYGKCRDPELAEHPWISSFSCLCFKNPDLNKEIQNLKEQLINLDRSSEEFIEAAENYARLRDLAKNEEQELVIHAQITGSTISKTILNLSPENTDFDVVIFDEASMAVVPQIVMAAFYASRSFICIGDFHQLPPVVKSRNNPYLEKDIFWLTGIEKAILSGQSHYWLTMLDTQFRMPDELAETISRLMYDRMLRSAADDQKQALDQTGISEKCPFEIVDLSSLCAKTKRDFSGSHYSLLSTLPVMSAAAAFARKGKSVAIITPYNRQASIYRNILWSLDPELAKRITCATVHSFQGSERDIVLFETVDAVYERFPGYPLRTRNNREADRLFNVALSRAKERFILFTDLPFMLERLDAKRNLSRFIQSCIQKHCIRNIVEMSGLLVGTAGRGFQVFSWKEGTEEMQKDLQKPVSEIRLDLLKSNPLLSESLLIRQVRNLHSGSRCSIRVSDEDLLEADYLKQAAVVNEWLNLSVLILNRKTVWLSCIRNPESGLNCKKTDLLFRIESDHFASTLILLLEMDQLKARKQDSDNQDSSILTLNDIHRPVMNFQTYISSRYKCPQCKKPLRLVRRKGGSPFLSCSGYPDCSYLMDIDEAFLQNYLDLKHPVCPHDGTPLKVVRTKRELVLACSSSEKKHFLNLMEI